MFKKLFYVLFFLQVGAGWDRVYVSLSGLELCLRLASNLQFFCLWLQSAGIIGMYHHTRPGTLCSKLTNLPPICGGFNCFWCPLTLTCTNKSPYIFYSSDSRQHGFCYFFVCFGDFFVVLALCPGPLACRVYAQSEIYLQLVCLTCAINR